MEFAAHSPEGDEGTVIPGTSDDWESEEAVVPRFASDDETYTAFLFPGGVTEAAAGVDPAQEDAVGHPVSEGAIDPTGYAPVATSSNAHVSPDVSQVSGVTAGPDGTTQPGSRGSNLSTRFQTLLSRWNRTWQAR